MKMSFLFTFAVVADSHIRPDQVDRQLTYPSDQLANARNRFAVEQINRFAPDFVVHLGDVVHPIPAVPEHEATVKVARELFQGVETRLYVLPGNHDVGDKPNTWVPVPAVDERSHAVFEKYWGKSYFSFDYKNCHFVLINSPVLNSGLELEYQQREWLEQDLASNRAARRRIYLFTHYPLYLTQVDEQEHYDNIGEPARSWLLSLLEKYGVEAVFAGHAHTFFYNRHHNTDLYVLPSVTFLRPEFSGLFDVGPASEYGRNDVEKLGFFVVRVRSAGHTTEWIRTRGRSQEQRGEIATRPFSLSGSESDAKVAPVGVSLRCAWAAPNELSSGNLDEFTRKPARNDYLLAALWDLGIRKLRLPIGDLLNPDTRDRMGVLQAKGHTFTVFSPGVPTRHLRETVVRHHDLIDAWEVVVPWGHMEDALDGMLDVKQRAAVRMILSRMDTLADQLRNPEFQFSHFPNHGFRPEDCDLLSARLAEWGGAEAVDGFVFRVTAEVPPWDGFRLAMRAAAELSRAAIVHVQLQRDDEGVAYENDRLIAHRVTETLAAAWATGIEVFLDTLMDQDRGYYPRHALIDRRCNPRLAYHAIRHLQYALGWGRRGITMDRLGVTLGIRAFAIAGVAIAIQLGGPGAVFWMLISAVFGMSAKFGSCVLAQLYRRRNPDGSISGGPMYYLDQGFGAKGGWWAPMGKCLGFGYAMMIVAGAFGGASMFQANQSFEAFSGSFAVPPTYNWAFGLALAVLVGLVIIGGIKRIAVVTARVVPAMGLLYVLASLLIIGKNMARVPDALSLILRSAFEGNAYYGGIVGTFVWGIRRAAFSNEAGGGSAVIVHAAAQTDEPVRQGLVAMIGPFVDTIIICSMTALVVIVTDAWRDPTIPREAGVMVVAEAFRTVADWFPYVLTMCILLFAYSTMISWCYYGEQGWGYLLDHLGRRSMKAVIVFRLLFLSFVFLGAVTRLQEVLDFTDMIGLSRSFPNIVGSLILAPVVLHHFRGYWRRYTSGRMRPSFELGNRGEAE